MAAAAGAAKASASAGAAAAANVDSYIGSLIGLVTKSEIRYEGFLFHLNAQETTIGLRNVKSFGTEGRKNDGPQVPASNKIYEYIFFRGSDIKDLQVISSPPLKSTPSLPDDPAIIQSHFSRPTSTPTSLVSSGAAQVSAFSSNAQSGFRVPSLQGSPALHQSLENPGSLGSSLPALHVNNNRPAMPNYWPGIPGSSGGISQFQHQNFPPPPQGLVVSHPVHQQSDASTMNAPSATLAVNIVEPPRSLLPPVCTGSPNVLPPMPPSSATQSNLGLFSIPVFNLSPVLMSNNTSSSPTTLTMNTSSQFVSSSMTSLDLTSSVAPVCESARSVVSPALPYPSMSLSAKSSTETPSMSLDKTLQPSSLTSGPLLQLNLKEVSSPHSSHNVNNNTELVQSSKSKPLLPELENAVEPGQQIAKPPAVSLTSSPLLQPNLKEVSSSHSSHNVNNNTEHVQSSKSKHLLPESESAEPGQRIAKPPAKTMHGAASSSHCHDRQNLPGMRDEMHEDVVNTPQGSRSCARGRVNGSYGAASHSYYGHRNRTNARGHKLNRPLHTHQNHRSLGRENGPNGISLHGHRLGRCHANGGSKGAHSVAKFTEDFDFEAMNEKFNKEEIWGLLGRTTKAGSEDKDGDGDGDGEETYENDDQEEAGDRLLKADRKPVYCKDDFFDTLSCNTLDREPGEGKVKFSERRRIDKETFGEIHKHQRGRGIQGPRRAGGFQGSYRGRGYDNNAGRDRGRTVWSRVT